MTSRQGKYTSMVTLCRVCGDQARFMHYGGLVCSSCKTFFRRYASYRKYPLQCCFNGNCLITIATRKTCPACRYEKCLTIGMSEDYIRKKDFSGMYTPKQKNTITLISTLNLLQADQSSLDRSQWRTFSNVIHAFDTFMPIATTRQTIIDLSNRSSTISIDMSPLLSMFTTFYTSTESFINSSPDFQILTRDEKTSLYQRNLHGVLHLSATLVYHLAGMFHSSNNDHLLISSYGYEIFIQIKRIASLFDYDLIIMKFYLFILAFSSSCYIVDPLDQTNDDRFLQGTFRLFGSQNFYLEALWKYMMYRYGYYDAALRFARMSKHMLDLLKISEDAQQRNQMHQEFIEEMSVKSEEILNTSEETFVPLWGKTSDSSL